jgi:CRP/FNR family cyclic AMP-dependent transcriptional regulator
MNLSSQPAREKLLTSLRPNLRGLASRGSIRSYPKHSVIINEGEAGDALFVLLQGRV